MRYIDDHCLSIGYLPPSLPPSLPPALSGGPLSILQEVAQEFGLQGVREVCVKKVVREEVGLDLIEVKFKVCARVCHTQTYICLSLSARLAL